MGRCVRWCIKAPLAALVVAISAVGFALFMRHQQNPDAMFAFMNAHNQTYNPPAIHSRIRNDEYPGDHFFFQWWNYLVFDADTHDHFNIIYQYTKFPSQSANQNHAIVGFKHGQGPRAVSQSRSVVPMTQLAFENVADLKFRIPDRGVAHSQTFIDDDSYRLVASMTAEESTTGVPVEWDLSLTRVHGSFEARDTEDGNKDPAVCSMVSSLFGYNSMVEGTIKEGDKVYRIGKNQRYRAYAAGSWGCQLPNGVPAVNYPWTWFWLVVPGSSPAEDLSLVFGTARFQTNSALLGDLYGGYGIVSLSSASSSASSSAASSSAASSSSSSSAASSSAASSASSSSSPMISARMAKLHHNATLPLPLLASASDGYLSRYELHYDQWAEFNDEYGSARIPLVQNYRMVTKTHDFTVNFTSTIDQYFRAPVVVEKDLRSRVFSDFRAVGVQARILIKKRARRAPKQGEGAGEVKREEGEVKGADEGEDEVVVFDGTVSTMNALEYAYEPELAKPINL